MDRDDIWSAIRAANAAWMTGRPHEVASLFADDVVMILPGARGRVDGREAMVASFVDYCASVRTYSFEERDHDVVVRGDHAVATYVFAVRYEYGGAMFDDEGQEILVFERRAEGWRAVWRSQITTSSKRSTQNRVGCGSSVGI